MASRPCRIVWADEALRTLQSLPHPVRGKIVQLIELLSVFPEMYAVETFGRWAGLRRFFILNLVVYYAYWPQDEAAYIEVIVPARSSRS